MGFITPAFAGAVLTAGTTLASTLLSATQADQARRDRRKAADKQTVIETAARQRELLLESRKTRTQQRFAASRGGSILSGSPSEAEAGKNVLLGQ